MKLPPILGHAIALLFGAIIFFGGMTIVAVFVAAPFSEWVGAQTRGWPAWATLGSIVVFVVGGQMIARWMIRRDQRKAAAATRRAYGDIVEPRS